MNRQIDATPELHLIQFAKLWIQCKTGSMKILCEIAYTVLAHLEQVANDKNAMIEKIRKHVEDNAEVREAIRLTGKEVMERYPVEDSIDDFESTLWTKEGPDQGVLCRNVKPMFQN